MYKNLKIIKRLYSNKIINESVNYTNTINLPKSKFPQRLSNNKRNEIEENINKKCFSRLYNWQRNNLKTTDFVLHDGPPYSNGELHMGHAVNKILKDITLRHKVINKNRVHYVAGWDCHGLPIELKAMLGNKDTNALQIRQNARKFALETLETQKKEFASWGIMGDWSNNENIYKTIDVKYVKNQLKIFYELYKKRLIYRDMKPVYWSPSSKTALAEAELEYDHNYQSPSLTLAIEMVNIPNEIRKIAENKKIYALIWTTTPWTLPANQAICYNNDLEYSLIKLDNRDDYFIIATELINDLTSNSVTLFKFHGSLLNDCTYYHPINKKETCPFLNGKHVQASKGTGLVHTAPSHGPDDFLIAIDNKIPLKCLIDENGDYTIEAPSFLQNKNVLKDGNSLVIKHLESNVIIKLDKIQHSYPIDWRTKEPVIFRASNQWFINTEMIKAQAIDEISKVMVYPRGTAEGSKNALITLLEKRPYWCISRQRAWGVPIPVFYDKKSGQPIIDKRILEHLFSIFSTDESIDLWWKLDIKDLIPETVIHDLNLNIEDIEKGKDILDIWFDSGISWSNVLENNKIADLYLEGIDQFTGWFQSSLMTSVALRGISPYKSLFVHGFTVDEKGHKMSKSIGNIISPKNIIEKYGIDPMRWWIASHGTQHSSIIVSNNLLKSSQENLQKIRLILRYFVGAINNSNDDEIYNKDINFTKLSYLDQYFLNQLSNYHDEIFLSYNQYEYNRATTIINNFLTNSVSGLYLNIIKDRLYCDTNDNYNNLKNILTITYKLLCKTLWPIVPFIIEENWSYYDTKQFYEHDNESNLQCIKNYIANNNNNIIETCLNLRDNLNKLLKNRNSWTLDITIQCKDENELFILKNLHNEFDKKIENSELCELLQVSSINLLKDINNKSLNEWNIVIDSDNRKFCPRCRRFKLNNNETICKRCDKVLIEKFKN